ncbi:transcriptional regulator, AraC family protein [Plesiocystis pacifica SIR-1]|uniref:Transcriptional regulator, AraC family protein n=1 Tax=Plesiocystis pacifica SIR-1 TaxID=391625 RepID=A6G6V9_9BACT|nr:AraC family transcriptional regulator [Plesiocystis pacifica]EDM78412.1 transcriptional regulator, AraC family protein [Plesiocystis pacifica SIR-1]
MSTFEFDFVPRGVKPPGDQLVESIWYARGTIPYRRERIAPTGSTVAVFVLGDAILQTPRDGQGPTLRAEQGFLIGPHDGPVINEPTGETFAVGIVCTPVGCEAVFGLRPASLRGRVVDLMEAWPPAAELRRRLLASKGSDAMLAALEGALAALAERDHEVKGIERCAAAVAMLEADPTRPVADIAQALDISHGYLDREFTRVVGLSPRRLARLLRMRRLLALIDAHGPVRWAERALDLGWSDQAHLVRDFKRHTGVTPTAYLAAQRTHYPPDEHGDGAGFVPES